jgi:hypothetical protein
MEVTITTCLAAEDVKDDTGWKNFRRVYILQLGLGKKNYITPTTYFRSHFSALIFTSHQVVLDIFIRYYS